MENTPEAAGESTQAPQTEATPQTTNSEPTQALESNSVDLHGFTSEDLAEMRKFYDANGGFKAVKSKISNYQPGKALETPQTVAEPQNDKESTSQPQQAPEPFKTPQGAITASEFLAEQYFRSLASEEKYANISKEIASGEYLKEMSAFGIQPLNQDGSINDQKVRMYLDLKSQTVPAKPTESEPNASAAPTVTYTEVGDNISSIDQAYKVLMEPGNPGAQKAEEYIKNYLNPNSGNNKKM